MPTHPPEPNDRDNLALQTPGLDRFLIEDTRPPIRFLTPRESAERLRADFHAVAAGDEALTPHIAFMLWRWSRAVATALGRCSEEEPLEYALAEHKPCPWSRRLVAKPTPSQRALLRQDSTSVLYLAVTQGLTLLPPRTGLADIELWCETFASVAGDLWINQAPKGPEVLAVLTDPRRAVAINVTREQVWRVEELVIDEFQHLMVSSGERAAQEHFRERYGVTRREALSLVRLARNDAYQYGRSSVEEDRALMVAMLKRYLARAQQTMNMADEMRALKQLAQVQGLTRTEPEDKAAEFLGVVKKIAAEQDQRMLLPEAAEAFGLDEADLAEAVAESESLVPREAPYFVIPDQRPAEGPKVAEEKALLEFDAEEPGR